MTEKKIDKIICIQGTDCVFVTDATLKSYNDWLDGKYINGKQSKELQSYLNNWYQLDKIPTKIERKTSLKYVNWRYILIDPSMACKDYPFELTRDAVAKYDDDEYVWYWKSDTPYYKWRSLYKEEKDTVLGEFEEIEFEISQHIKVKYDLAQESWKFDNKTLRNSSIDQQLLDKLAFPAPILIDRPCKLSSTETYKIIREFVKDNINKKYAYISSDYDFCFTIKKKFKFQNTKPCRTNINWAYPRRKKKLETRYITEREVTIFKMSHGKGYDNYPIIEGFEGKNYKNLNKNVNEYLRKLIYEINMPLKDCPICQGTGVIVETYK